MKRMQFTEDEAYLIAQALQGFLEVQQNIFKIVNADLEKRREKQRDKAIPVIYLPLLESDCNIPTLRALIQRFDY